MTQNGSDLQAQITTINNHLRLQMQTLELKVQKLEIEVRVLQEQMSRK